MPTLLAASGFQALTRTERGWTRAAAVAGTGSGMDDLVAARRARCGNLG